VGFTEAEGSFYFVKKKLSNLENLSESNKLQAQIMIRAEFRLCQNNNFFLLDKIKEKLKIIRKVGLLSNSSNHYYIVAASNSSLQNVINFYTNPNLVKLKGMKYLEFML
jgi:hypothetical protein